MGYCQIILSNVYFCLHLALVTNACRFPDDSKSNLHVTSAIQEVKYASQARSGFI